MKKLLEDMCKLACDRQADRQTSCQGILRAMHMHRAVKMKKMIRNAHADPDHHEKLNF